MVNVVNAKRNRGRQLVVGERDYLSDEGYDDVSDFIVHAEVESDGAEIASSVDEIKEEVEENQKGAEQEDQEVPKETMGLEDLEGSIHGDSMAPVRCGSIIRSCSESESDILTSSTKSGRRKKVNLLLDEDTSNVEEPAEDEVDNSPFRDGEEEEKQKNVRQESRYAEVLPRLSPLERIKMAQNAALDEIDVQNPELTGSESISLLTDEGDPGTSSTGQSDGIENSSYGSDGRDSKEINVKTRIEGAGTGGALTGDSKNGWQRCATLCALACTSLLC